MSNLHHAASQHHADSVHWNNQQIAIQQHTHSQVGRKMNTSRSNAPDCKYKEKRGSTTERWRDNYDERDVITELFVSNCYRLT